MLLLYTSVLFAALAAAVANPDAVAINIALGSDGDVPSLSISGANLTSKWIEGSRYWQIVELWLTNTDNSKFLTDAHDVVVRVESDALRTVAHRPVRRLAPGQKVLVQVGVKNRNKVPVGSECSATVYAVSGANGGEVQAKLGISGICGIGDYSATEDSLETHRTPDWYDGLKYGIFIHWGMYSVPAFGNVGTKENYAEWYWKWMHNASDRTETFQYHEKTYGKNFNYDQFAANFTGKGFDPKAWVDLFANSGAQYFVPTTKHHEGFALFNFSEAVSKRSSVHMGPKRDFIKELFTASRKYQPHLRLGTYFSLPEWYNPIYKYTSDFPGGPPINPYTGKELEYTGYVPHKDFVNDIQVPQMNALAYDYGTEIMWCDIGGPNNSTEMLSSWINWAKQQGRQVTFNKRCGLKGDFDTPEYQPNPATGLERKWESSRGMDPHSYGYNQVTPDNLYLTGEDIVTSLIDIVSYNGNFLLDIGPTGNGSIPQVMQRNLLDAGSWINERKESIFNTRFWTVTTGKDALRYTTTRDAFYIHHIGKPPAELVITDPVPILPRDAVIVLGGKAAGKRVKFTSKGLGKLTLHLCDNVLNGDRYVWTFKIAYARQ